jgi:transposase
MELRQARQSWQEAAQGAGVQTSRATAYRWWQAYRRQGDAALVDERYGHPTKAREPVLNFLESRWSQAPQTKSNVIQPEVCEQFGQVISITHRNRLRKAQGLATSPEKKLLCPEASYDCSWPPPLMKQDCSPA